MARSNLLRHLAPSVVLALLGFLLAYQFVDPAPPKELTIAAGNPQGAYTLFAHKYQELLAHEDIRLDILETAGSIDNIRRLRADKPRVDVAFVQSGAAAEQDKEGLFSLGSLYFEPLWVFYRSEQPLTRLPELAGKRIAIGPEGSGTQALSVQLLDDNADAMPGTVRVLLDERDALRRLSDGDIDAMFLVASPKSETVIRLLNTPGVRLLSFERADAYERRYRSLSHVVLPEGALDLDKNIPPQDTHLLAAAANLVVRSDLHPALVDLLLQTAGIVHGEGGWFEANGQFPADDYLEFPISPDARRHYKFGPPILQRFLPFWAASFIDRMKVMLLPLIALFIPLMKIMPPLYRWRMRSRVYRWYRELQDIDLGLFQSTGLPVDRFSKELNRIEHEVANVDVPLSFADELFNLRLHIELIRRRLQLKKTELERRSGEEPGQNTGNHTQ